MIIGFLRYKWDKPVNSLLKDLIKFCAKDSRKRSDVTYRCKLFKRAIMEVVYRLAHFIMGFFTQP